MSTPLFITINDIKKFTALNGNLDNDKIIQFCLVAQDIHLQGIIGSNLYEKISNDIINDTLTGDYLDLVNNHLKKILIHYTMVEFLPFSAYSVSNSGVYKRTAENADSVEKNEVDYLVEKERDIAEHYTERFIKYMCANPTKFPEYRNNSSEDMIPNKKAYSSGWFIDYTSEDERKKYENLEL